MDECADWLGEAPVFFTIDWHIAYWQTEIPQASHDKITFYSPHWLFRFIRVPVGLQNGPASLQRALGIVWSRVK